MMINPKSAPLLLLLGLVILSCKNDSVETQEPVDGNTAIQLSDTLFGKLSAKQQYYQHFVFEIPETYQLALDSLADWVVENEPGGLWFKNWNIDSLIRFKVKLDTLDIIPPIYYTNYFEHLRLPEYPYWDASPLNRKRKWAGVFKNDQIGMIDFGTDFKKSEKFRKWIDEWKKNGGQQFVTAHFEDKNAKNEYARFEAQLKGSDELVYIELEHFDTVQLQGFRDMNDFKGEFIVRLANRESINMQLAGGADYILVSLGVNGFDHPPFENWSAPEDEKAPFNESTRRILIVKSGIEQNAVAKDIAAQIEAVKLNLLYGANALLQNAGENIPLTAGARVYATDKIKLDTRIIEANKLSIYKKDLAATLGDVANAEGARVIILNDSVGEEEKEKIRNLTTDQEIIICFSNPDLYSDLAESPNLVFFTRSTDEKKDYSVLIQQLTGQLAFEGDFVQEDKILSGQKKSKLKLARTRPEFVGLNADTLKKIDWAVGSALNGQAFPGCQVLIAKQGCIIYDKSFGYHTYDRVQPVTATSVYDLASLTKVVSTTMVGMKLYEMGAYQLTDSLEKYLPDSLSEILPYPSTIRNITFQDLFIHKSGMPAGFPILRYMQYTNEEIGRFDKYYCDLADSVYAIEVAENFYLDLDYRDSMWIKLNQIWLDPSRPYRYSDVNMNILYFIFRSVIENNPENYGYKLKEAERMKRNLFVELLYDTFYSPLGMERSQYKPLRHFSKNEIVPTENETYWRKQLLHGHVHDPNAALYGGIGGNAGVFSTTNDLALLGEMLLRKGTYDGKQYLKPETVVRFTAVQPDSHRGLGFNKPSLNTSAFGCADSASVETFGHTGFTGTCIWVDPVNELTYILLSNRVHPKVNNRIYQYGIRDRAHQLAYDAMLF